MTGITITSKDAERIARSFNDLTGPKGLNRIRGKAVNQIGAKVRKQTRSLAGVVFGTSAAALSVQGKAASPGSTNPAYKLRFASKIPIAKLKAKHRKVTTQARQEILDHRHAERSGDPVPVDPARRHEVYFVEGRTSSRTRRRRRLHQSKNGV